MAYEIFLVEDIPPMTSHPWRLRSSIGRNTFSRWKVPWRIATSAKPDRGAWYCTSWGASEWMNGWWKAALRRRLLTVGPVVVATVYKRTNSQISTCIVYGSLKSGPSTDATPWVVLWSVSSVMVECAGFVVAYINHQLHAACLLEAMGAMGGKMWTGKFIFCLEPHVDGRVHTDVLK